MDRIQTFQEFLATSSADVSVLSFMINLLIAAFLSSILAWVYVNYGKALSNRDSFSRNFLILSMTIMVIITIVKSSLALSLGLVGALSIVRYRTAIKEPEELAYTFVAIAIGLGMGADQVLITILSFTVMVILIIVRSKINKTSVSEFVNFRVYGPADQVNIEKINNVLAGHTIELKLKRFDEEDGCVEVLYTAIFGSMDDMVAAKKELNELSSDFNLSYFENIGSI
ncbi:MAG: DUF4956 domain-containing protein [Kordiimonadaceae bacterium]|jgi:hypothetical protein|nr:DUF4956 domain-containing protein [Kordiimonadaceae bacterium]MBT6036471.1 DUF4956 domain-containing protein [Kordiimonadaceae bacterium]MBT6329382.1 DUF4956 domain-containing protein [Kordiimonadaceae bacterium]